MKINHLVRSYGDNKERKEADKRARKHLRREDKTHYTEFKIKGKIKRRLKRIKHKVAGEAKLNNT